MISLGPNDIHIWMADYDRIDSEEILDGYRPLLNAAETAQQGRFFQARDRRRYLVTRALVRTVLSRYAPIAPTDWMFANNRFGRPEIANDGAGAGLSFNISHTHSLIVVGVARDRALGIDVEKLHARDVSIDIAERFFSPREVADLAVVPPDRQVERFFEYWTFKESYIKARGMGLSLPLDKFSFRFPDDGRVEVAISEELADVPHRWMFWQFRPSPEYLVAICAERMDKQPPKLVFRSMVPHLHEEIVALATCRSSE